MCIGWGKKVYIRTLSMATFLSLYQYHQTQHPDIPISVSVSSNSILSELPPTINPLLVKMKIGAISTAALTVLFAALTHAQNVTFCGAAGACYNLEFPTDETRVPIGMSSSPICSHSI